MAEFNGIRTTGMSFLAGRYVETTRGLKFAPVYSPPVNPVVIPTTGQLWPRI